MRITRVSSRRLILPVLATLVIVVAACSAGPATRSAPAATRRDDDPRRRVTHQPADGRRPDVRALADHPPGHVHARPGRRGAVPERIVAAVIADAAGRTGAAAPDITVLTATSVTWPNGALGCPQPGFAYTDMIVPGYRVVVEAAGTTLDYRIGAGGTPQLCENPPGPG